MSIWMVDRLMLLKIPSLKKSNFEFDINLKLSTATFIAVLFQIVGSDVLEANCSHYINIIFTSPNVNVLKASNFHQETTH